MHSEGFQPDDITISSVLSAVGDLKRLNIGIQILCYVIKLGLLHCKFVICALMDVFGKCACARELIKAFEETDEELMDVGARNALITGLSRNGLIDLALETFELQGGLTEEGWQFFNSMYRDQGIEAKMERYSCMVNLLGCSGKLEEAYAIIKQMPFEPNACVWGALLSSCRLHNNISLGEIAVRNLFKLEPNNPGNYILFSNIYVAKAMWDEVDAVRDVMKSRGMKKNPGCSWIEIKNQVHKLLAGDKSHPQMTEIIEKLYKLSMEMRKAGCLPNTNLVLQDVDEQDKEQILCGHSEKLAVAFGLLNTPPGSPPASNKKSQNLW
ncbi:hypothetical protein REPUB_Repub02eG0014600 [Reevesia pubescens]